MTIFEAFCLDLPMSLPSPVGEGFFHPDQQQGCPLRLLFQCGQQTQPIVIG